MAVSQGHFYHDEDTWHDGILSLPNAATLSGTGNGLRKKIYWRPEIRAELIPNSESAAFDALQELLKRVIDDQIGRSNRVASLLSGGLDSSAVAALASISLRKRNQTLLAISAIVPAENRQTYSDEREYIDEFQSWPAIRIEYITAAGAGPFDLIQDPSRFEETFALTSRTYLYDAFVSTARENGADLIMDGVCGEYGPTCYGYGYLVQLATGFRLSRLFAVLNEIQRVSGISPVRTLAGDFLTTLLPTRRFRPAVYLRREFLKECESFPVVTRHWRDHRLTQRDTLVNSLRNHAARRMPAASAGVRFGLPLFDHRLLEFCLALTGDMKLRGGYSRYLVRRSLDGILPPAIQWRTDKRPFSCDYPARYAAQVWRAREFVAEIADHDPVRTIVDVERLRKELSPSGAPADSWDALISIPQSIYLICFLRQFAEFRL